MQTKTPHHTSELTTGRSTFDFTTMASASPILPTFCGYIASTQDALLLFEACLSGALNHVARRPHDRERASLIKSGNVFIYEDTSSGIKRWTDGVPWSPSRILGNFLIYRELERPFPPGEKKRAMKRIKRSPGTRKAPEPYGSFSNEMSNGHNAASAAASTFDSTDSNSLSKETERSLIGSLVDSYGFKEEGLVKKTVSVTVGGVSHHLVSYYTIADVMNNRFNTPTKDPRFQHITPRPDLITKQNFRAAIDEVDNLGRVDDRSVYNAYSGYEMTNQSIAHRAMPLPTPPISYPQTSSVFNNYTMAPHPAYSDGTSSYSTQYAPTPTIYPPPKPENYDMGRYRQQRYNSVVGVSSHSPQSQIPSANNSFARRPSNHDSSNSVVSAFSCISSGSHESKLSNDSGYSSTEFYGALKESPNIPQNYPTQRSLHTTAMQESFDRLPPSPYGHIETPVKSENMWPMGLASAGHGHYMTPEAVQHQPWASTGTS